MDGGAWWAAVHGVAWGWTRLSDFTFTFHFHTLEKEMATHSSVLAWRFPGTGEPGGLLSLGSHRVGHDWSNIAAVPGLSCSMGDVVPWSGIKPRPLHWEHRVLATGPPGKSHMYHFKLEFSSFLTILPGMGWLDHMVTLFLFLRVLHTVLHSGYTSLHSHQQSLYTFIYQS